MPARRCKSSKSGESQEGLRKSPRIKNIPKAVEEPEKLTKKSRRKAVKLDNSMSETTSPFPDSFNTPSTSTGKTENVCSFYKVSDSDVSGGSPTFSRSLIRYFLKVDSPGMDDLKSKRFNSSFRYERPRNRDSLKIFTEEEDKDKNYFLDNELTNIPKLKFDMPDIPGSAHTKVFESIPLINEDSDEELKLEVGGKRRKSTRCTEFKGKPLPEQCLNFDYSAVLNSESSHDAENDHEKEEVPCEADSPKNNSSILLSLLSSPSNEAVTPYKSNSQSSIGCNLSYTKEDEMLLSKYKDVMTDRQLNVVLTRLPIDSQLLQLCDKKKLNPKSIDFQGKRKAAKLNANEKVKVPRQGLSKLQKKKRGNIKP